MNQLVGDYSLDEVLTEKRSVIRVEARKATQTLLDELDRGGELKGCGIMITDLQMQRVTPPNTVKPAYDAVLAAIQKSSQLQNEANKERNMLLPAAEAMAEEVLARSTVPAPRGCTGHIGLALDHCVCPTHTCKDFRSNSRAFAQA